MGKANAAGVKPQRELPLESDPQDEGHGRTRYDANIVTLSGRVVSKEIDRVIGTTSAVSEEHCTTCFVLNVVRNKDGAGSRVNVSCRAFGTGHYKAMDEGDMIAVLGELGNTRDGKGLYVDVKHWHLLEPRGWRGKKQEGSNE